MVPQTGTDNYKEAKELDLASKKFRLNINIGKTKFITNLVASENKLVYNLPIGQIYSYKYFGHEVRLKRDNQTYEIGKREDLTWTAFGK